MLKAADNVVKAFDKEERKKDYELLKKDSNYTDVEYSEKTNGLKATHIDHKFNTKYAFYEKEAREILFENGYKVILESESAAEGIKTPDGKLNDVLFDIKTVLGDGGKLGKNNSINKLKRGNLQGVKQVVLYFPSKKLFKKNQ